MRREEKQAERQKEKNERQREAKKREASPQQQREESERKPYASAHIVDREERKTPARIL